MDELKIALHSECPYQGFPEGGLKEILCLHMHREILHPLFGIPTLIALSMASWIVIADLLPHSLVSF
jgi:hypothetical protein